LGIGRRIERSRRRVGAGRLGPRRRRGAVRGLYLFGLLLGLLGTVAVVYATRDKPCLTDEERRARSAARYGARVGGIAGVGVVSAAGTAADLTGVGITSGLAVIGNIAGGGMGAGACVLVAATDLVAGLLGWF
jgi:hypothetical protein